MARLLQLETFDLPGPADSYASRAQAEVEDLKLASYEEGYAAGWDDAVAAQSSEIARLRADLGRNLREMSLSYRDARRHVLAALAPLLQHMVTKVLPQIAHQSLGPLILEHLQPLSEAMTAAPVIVKTSRANREVVETLLSDAGGLPVSVVEEPTLGDGEAYLKTTQGEVHVDLDGAIAAISAAVGTFLQIEKDQEL